MSWHYHRPSPDEYITDEEYQDALRAYDDAESQYIDDYVEMKMEERYEN